MWDICPKFLTPVLVLHRNKTVKYMFSLCTKLWTAPSSSPAIFFACHGMRMLRWATAKAWWNKSTDPMVLGSPWICRSSSRPFRFVLIILTFWRFFREFELVGMRERIDRSPVNGIFDALSMILAWYCLAASLWFLCTTSWASFPGSFCFSLSILITIWQAGTHLDTRYSTYFILVFVFFARCSVHPVCLLLTIGFSCFCNKSVLVKWAMDPLATIQWLYSISSLCFSLACYTVDFTNRIKAIDAMLDSTSTPSAECLETLAGRSAVRCCWLAGINNWCFWIVITMVKRTLEGGIYHELVENHLPICTVCAPFLGIGIALVFLFSRSQSQWKADCLLTCFCCLPATLLLSNWSLTVNSLRQQGRLPLIWLYSVSYSLRIVTFFESLISLQIIVQAGCNPGICAVPAAFFCTFLPPLLCSASKCLMKPLHISWGRWHFVIIKSLTSGCFALSWYATWLITFGLLRLFKILMIHMETLRSQRFHRVTCVARTPELLTKNSWPKSRSIKRIFRRCLNVFMVFTEQICLSAETKDQLPADQNKCLGSEHKRHSRSA